MADIWLVSNQFLENFDYASPIHQTHNQALPEKLCAPMGAKETVNNLGLISCNTQQGWVCVKIKYAQIWLLNNILNQLGWFKTLQVLGYVVYRWYILEYNSNNWDWYILYNIYIYIHHKIYFVYRWLVGFAPSLHSHHQLSWQKNYVAMTAT